MNAPGQQTEYAYCPEIVDDDYGHPVLCGQPAEVVGRFTLWSTAGPICHVVVRCLLGTHELTPTIDQVVLME